MTRLVLDASVLVSTVVAHPESRLTRLLEQVRRREVEMVICDHLLDEVERALKTKYFIERVTPPERTAYLAFLRATGRLMPDPTDPPALLRDPNDDYLVALASVSQATAIVTGDKDLLEHANLDPPAITVRQACRQLDIADI